MRDLNIFRDCLVRFVGRWIFIQTDYAYAMCAPTKLCTICRQQPSKMLLLCDVNAVIIIANVLKWGLGVGFSRFECWGHGKGAGGLNWGSGGYPMTALPWITFVQFLRNICIYIPISLGLTLTTSPGIQPYLQILHIKWVNVKRKYLRIFIAPIWGFLYYFFVNHLKPRRRFPFWRWYLIWNCFSRLNKDYYQLCSFRFG